MKVVGNGNKVEVARFGRNREFNEPTGCVFFAREGQSKRNHRRAPGPYMPLSCRCCWARRRQQHFAAHRRVELLGGAGLPKSRISRAALESRDLIGQAKAVIMATLRSTAIALWSTSRRTNRK